MITLPKNLQEEFHRTKNVDIDLNQIPDKTKRLWWQDEFGHEWDALITDRVRGSGCPYCKGKFGIPGVTDLPTTHPDLAAEWDYAKNVSIDITRIKAGSKKKAWWLCPQGHEYETAIQNRALNDTTCPYCANRALLPGFNDLGTTHPTVAAQWHPTKNGNLLPEQVFAGGSRKVWWQDEFGHEWESSIISRTIQNQDCPYCVGQKALAGFNDLATLNPDIAAEWHPTKNGNPTPQDVTAGSKTKAWWLCEKGHSWFIEVSARKHTGCPQCASALLASAIPKVERTSLPDNPKLAAEWKLQNSKDEKEVFDIVERLGFSPVANEQTVLPGNNIAIYIPGKSIGIEFNGTYWHSEAQGKGRNYYYDKWLAAKQAGIQIIQIWEDDWQDRKPAVLRALAHKLGVTNKLAELYPQLNVETAKVFARKTNVVELSTADAKNFLLTNHIQGYASGSHYIGLNDSEGILRALMVLKLEAGNTLNIVRYATNGSVVGGFTKLLKYAERTYTPNSFITFADHMISDGGLYENNGFVEDKEIRPDYMYVVDGERKHKFGYRLKKFRTDPSLLWDENLTERELALLNNIPRIWDAGKTRYRLNCI